QPPPDFRTPGQHEAAAGEREQLERPDPERRAQQHRVRDGLRDVQQGDPYDEPGGDREGDAPGASARDERQPGREQAEPVQDRERAITGQPGRERLQRVHELAEQEADYAPADQGGAQDDSAVRDTGHAEDPPRSRSRQRSARGRAHEGPIRVGNAGPLGRASAAGRQRRATQATSYSTRTESDAAADGFFLKPSSSAMRSIRSYSFSTSPNTTRMPASRA